MTNDSLSHYGILGMRWGVRRTEAQLARARGSTKTNTENEKKQADVDGVSASTKKSVKDMTDNEIKEKISRLELEKKYKELTKSTEQPKLFNGKKFVVNVLEKSGEQMAVQVVNHLAAKAINKAFKEEVVFANNKKK